MKFDYSKLFKKKDIFGSQTIVSVDELSRIFSGTISQWGTNAHMTQYSKSLYVFAAVNKIAMKTAAIDFHLYRITNKDGDSEEIFNHEILDLCAKFNPFQTKTEFLKTAWINKKLTGEAIWWKVRNSENKVIELWNLRPDLVTVVTDPLLFIKHYELQKADGTRQIFLPEDIIHFREPNPLNPFRGMSPLTPAQTRIETEQLAAQFQRNFFGNNARPDALLLTAENLDEEQRAQMTEAWEDRHKGSENSGRLGLLEGGMQYQQVSISQREMDYIESMKYTRDDILVALGVPKSVVTTDDVNFANADAGIRMFLSETITPEMAQICEVLNEFLLTPDFGEEYYLDFQDPTPADRQTQTNEFTAGFGKWLTTNEIRAQINLAPIEGGDVVAQIASPTGPVPTVAPGDNPAAKQKAMLQKQKTLKVLQGRPFLRKKFELMRTIGDEVTKAVAEEVARKLKAKTQPKLVEKKAEKKENTAVSDTARSLFSDVTVRELYYEYVNKKLDRRAKQYKEKLDIEFAKQQARVMAKMQELDSIKSFGKGRGRRKLAHFDIGSIMDEAEEAAVFAEISLPFLTDFAKQGGKDAAELTAGTFDYTDALKASIAKRASFLGKSVTDTTYQKLSETLSEGINNGEGIGDLSDRVSSVYGDIEDYRSLMIARTETTNANNEGMMEQFSQSDVVAGKEWVATLDSRTREEHVALNGEVVGVEDVFENGLDFPSEPNCRCVIAPAIIDSGKAFQTPMRKRVKKAAPTT